MDMEITCAGGKKVTATYRGFEVATDQPAKSGGEGSAPAPFDLFLASLGTCAAYYVVDFCQTRNIASDGIRVIQRTHTDRETRMITRIEQEIVLPAGFPEKYEAAVVRAASLCAVKKHLERAPSFEIVTKRA
jgi:putative redox protein